MNQVASSAKKPQVQNSSGQPAAAKGLRMCQTCGVPHGLVLDCPAFRTLAPNCRANFANSLAACTSCLSTYQMANPVVTVANLKVIDMTARFQLPGSKDHEILVGSMLYTDQKVKLHFQKIPCRWGHCARNCEKEGSCNSLDVSVELKGNELSRIDKIRKELEKKNWSVEMGSTGETDPTRNRKLLLPVHCNVHDRKVLKIDSVIDASHGYGSPVLSRSI